MEGENRIENVSDTALWVAVYRAQETERIDATFRDPLAAVLAGERGRQIAESMPGSRYTEWVLVTRTSTIDRYILKLCAEGADTIVNLGAGLDTRPYRLDLPANVRWIEVDFPAMISYKTEKLKGERTRCPLERIPLDLSRREERRALLKKINAEARKVIVLTEGVLVYLTNSQVQELAEDLRQTPHVAYWIHDWFSPDSLNLLRKLNVKKMRSAPTPFDPMNGWFEFFTPLGWVCRENVTYAEEGERIGRNRLLPWFMRFVPKLFPQAKIQMKNVGGSTILQRT